MSLRATLAAGCASCAVLPAALIAAWLLAITGSPSVIEIVLSVLAVLGSGVLAATLGWGLAQSVAAPMAELSYTARRMADGDLETPLPAQRAGSAAALGDALSELSGDLRVHQRALEGSREELREGLVRIGEALSSTHDLRGIHELVIDTAVATMQSSGGALYTTGDGWDALHLRTRRGDLAVGGDLIVGRGVLGSVFADGRSVFGETESGLLRTPTGTLRFDADEAYPRSVIAVPVSGSRGVTGVLAVYDRTDGRPFEESDVLRLTDFGVKAGMAMDNAVKFQEAQRLSLNDGLTGLWNYRYLSMALGREIKRSAEFGRPLALVMGDLDCFKAVNDVHGKQRGDRVLLEVSRRLSTVLREVDVLARYGGEEFVLLLPEATLGEAETVAELCAAVIRDQPFGDGTEPAIGLTMSLGVAAHPVHGGTSAELLREAGLALTTAKRAGRDQWRSAPVAAASRSAPGR